MYKELIKRKLHLAKIEVNKKIASEEKDLPQEEQKD
jgi:hypothetical protein